MSAAGVPYGFCECGCGQRTRINEYNCRSRGWIKGEPRRAIKGHGHHITPPKRSDPVARFWSKVNKTDSCWLWTSALAGRYGVFRAVADRTMVRAHRYSWELANGPIPEGVGVLHNCPGGDNPLCVNPAHLFLGTQLENMRDCRAKNRMPLGDKRFHSKLNPDKVRLVRQLVESGRSMRSVARDFGVSAPTVRTIVLRESWGWVV